jgi:hypothetical protein
VLAERKFIDPAPKLPFGKAAPKITLDAGRGLVPVLSGLGEKLQDDRRYRRWDVLHSLVGRHGLSRDVAVDPLHRIGRREW